MDPPWFRVTPRRTDSTRTLWWPQDERLCYHAPYDDEHAIADAHICCCHAGRVWCYPCRGERTADGRSRRDDGTVLQFRHGKRRVWANMSGAVSPRMSRRAYSRDEKTLDHHF